MPGLSGAVSGATSGAALGSFIPGVGTAIGAGIGGLVGLFGGRKKKPKPLPSVADYMAGGQTAYNTSLASGVSAAMPQFQDQLQGIRESAIRRGVDNGDIGTRNEGTLASAFQRNLANTAGSNASTLYQTALDQQAGERDYRTARSNARSQGRSDLLGTLGNLAGTYLGTKGGQATMGKLGGRMSRLFARRPTMRPLPSLPNRSNNVVGSY